MKQISSLVRSDSMFIACGKAAADDLLTPMLQALTQYYWGNSAPSCSPSTERMDWTKRLAGTDHCCVVHNHSHCWGKKCEKPFSRWQPYWEQFKSVHSQLLSWSISQKNQAFTKSMPSQKCNLSFHRISINYPRKHSTESILRNANLEATETHIQRWKLSAQWFPINTFRPGAQMFSAGGDTIVVVVGPWESYNSGSPVLCANCIEEPKASARGIILITSVVFGVLFQDVWIYQGELSQVSLWPSHLLQSHSRKSNVLRECCKHPSQRKTQVLFS